MNAALVLLALVGCALASDAPVQVADAPDVAAAKAHFFAIQKAETHRNLHGHHHGYAYHGYPYALGYHGYPYGLAHHGIHKRSAVEDTPEVAAAKAHFFAIQKAETHRNLAGHHHGYGYHGYPYALAYHGYPYALGHHAIHKRQAPEPVEDTPEVAAAKVHFKAIFDATAARDKHLAAHHGHLGYGHLGYAHHGYAHLGYPYALAHHAIHKRQAPEPVQDTPEVAAAKAAFAATYEAQAAAAEAAPDFDLDGAISTADGHLTAYHGYGHHGYGYHGYAGYGFPYYGVYHG